jgi:excisionase family DNA binding protein
MMAQTLLTVEETGRALGVSVATVWRRIRTGEIASVRRGGRRLVPRGALSRAAPKAGRGIPAFTADHPIFDLVGAARSGGGEPGARDKHAILEG